MIAGFFVFCVYNCARFSDAQNAEDMKLDEARGFCVLHAGARRHKTSTSADRRTAILPLVCLGQGFADQGWAAKWMSLLKSEKLLGKRPYLLPAWNEQTGAWANRRMTSGEGTLWLRECLSAASLERHSLDVLPSTHSCKCTLLSWLAKDGKYTLSERQIMGHHMDRPSTSALTYGRANFVPILVRVAMMIRRIRERSFAPEEIQRLEEESATHEANMNTPVVEAEESASEVGDAEELESEIAQIVPAPERRCVVIREPERFKQHRMSGVLHLILDGSRFACGRIRSENYIKPDDSSVLGAQMCEQCKASHHAATLK